MVAGKEVHHTQILKGVLEMCLLAIIVEERTYGYAMVRRLSEQGLKVASESSIYPALKRLKAQGLVVTELVDSSSGPARKYYECTPAGIDMLNNWIDDWYEVRAGVDAVTEQVSIRHGLVKTKVERKTLK